jgi:hypothetical protein
VASFHFAVKSISRGKGHSSTAAAAYRLGIKIACERTGDVHNYTKKQGVLHGEMLAPKGAPEWAFNPAEFWNKVEARDTRANARVAREFVVSLPHELSLTANIQLARDLAQLVVDRYETVAQIAIHAPDKGGDDRNVHLHLMFAPRTVDKDGFGDYTARVYDDFKKGPLEILAMREYVAMITNNALHAEGVAGRVDHRRLEDQAMSAVDRGDLKAARELDRLPTVKEGKKPLQARAKRQRNNRIRRSNEARQTKWDLMEEKARAESRLMPAYIEELTHERQETQSERPASGRSNPNPERRVGSPITASEIHRYEEWRGSPDYQSVLVMPEGRRPLSIEHGWNAERPAGVLPGDAPRPASDSQRVHTPRKIPWRSKGIPKPVTAAIFAGSTARTAVGSTKATAGADSYGRERLRQDDERLQLDVEAITEAKQRARMIEQSISPLKLADSQFIDQMARGTSAHNLDWIRHHNTVMTHQRYLAQHTDDEQKRSERMALAEKTLKSQRFALKAWREQNPKPTSMMEANEWRATWNAKKGEYQKLTSNVERLRQLTEESQLASTKVKRQHALDAMNAALKERRAIAPLPSEEKQHWKEFRFPEKPMQTGPPSTTSPGMTVPYPRLEPPKR